MANQTIRRISNLGKAIAIGTAVVLAAASGWAGQVTLAWDPNGETDLAGYKVHYGTVRGSYTASVDVHKTTTYTATGLAAGQTYYFAASAYDTAGNASGYSNEVSYAVPAVNGAPTTPAIPSGVSSGTAGSSYAFSTTASDPDGNSLEYRYDWGGGVLSTWGPATQSCSWSAAGQYGVKAQARDSLGALSAWSAAKAVTIAANQPGGQTTYRIWDNAAIPATVSASDTRAVELGMKFRAETSGSVTGVRFYKSAANTGRHVGNLWSRDGQLLSSVVFSNETASGWQEAIFPAPVAVTANTTYVISYHTDTGRYSVDQNYFASAINRSPLRALAQGEDGPNGVYKYGVSAFPTKGNSRNYWVDVVFNTAGTASAALAAVAPSVNAAAGSSVSPSSATVAAGSATAPSSRVTIPSGTLVAAASNAIADARGGSGAQLPADNAAAAGQSAKQQPNVPILVSPVNDEVVIASPVLRTDAFEHPNSMDSHAETRWQVFRDDDSTCVFDIQTNSSLTRLSLPNLVLDENTAYFWRAQFIDGDGDVSEWSDYGHFSTKSSRRDLNANGIPDAQEVAADVDLDRDGVKDGSQAGLKAVRMEGSSALIAVSIKNSPTAVAVQAVESQNPGLTWPPVAAKPSPMPFGLINFKIAVANPGDQATVRLYFSERAPRGSRWHQYDPVAGSWSDFSAYATFASDRRSVSLTLRDGGPGDADGVANGVIVNPSGLYVTEGNGWLLTWDRPWRTQQPN